LRQAQAVPTPAGRAAPQTLLSLHQLRLQKSLRDERKRKTLRAPCGEPLSAHSIFPCIACGAYHAGYQARAMREKRAASLAYRKDERKKVRLRMRAIRAERRKADVNNQGQPYKSARWQRKSANGVDAMASTISAFRIQ
jgi:hypothetical protein